VGAGAWQRQLRALCISSRYRELNPMAPGQRVSASGAALNPSSSQGPHSHPTVLLRLP
jgi:hypothetical protein